MNKTITQIHSVESLSIWYAITKDHQPIRIKYVDHEIIIDGNTILYHQEYLGLPYIDIALIKEKLEFNGFTIDIKDN